MDFLIERCFQLPISLFEAEKRGRKSEEDILTSKVFGILSKVDRTVMLNQFLEEVGISIPSNELVQSELELWKDYNGTIPDVSIESENNLIFIECKLGSQIRIEQLKREYSEGIESSKKFILICLTKDCVEPLEISQLKQEYDNIEWTNWQTINAQLRKVDVTSLDNISKGLLSDLADLLGSKSLRGFAGFNKKEVRHIMNGTASKENYFNEIVIFIDELRGLLELENLELKKERGFWVHRDGMGKKIDSPMEWITTHLTFPFGLKEWSFSYFWSDSYLFVRFYLDDDEDAKLLIGYSVRIDNNQTNQELVSKKSKQICIELKKMGKKLVLSEPYSETDYEEYSGEDLKTDLLKEENLEKIYRAEFCHSLSFEELFQPNLLTVTRDHLLEFAEFAHKLGITPNDLRNKKIDQEELPTSDENTSEM